MIIFSLSLAAAVSTPTENLKAKKTFQAWMDEHSNFRTICEEGKGWLVCKEQTKNELNYYVITHDFTHDYVAFSN